MTLERAAEIVLELARDNAITDVVFDFDSDDLKETAKEQEEAIEIVATVLSLEIGFK
jgi:putative methionine-R-sulfoxide reductase with GAF domain